MSKPLPRGRNSFSKAERAQRIAHLRGMLYIYVKHATTPGAWHSIKTCREAFPAYYDSEVREVLKMLEKEKLLVSRTYRGRLFYKESAHA